MSHTQKAQWFPQVTTAYGHNLIGGLSRVFHCNHYNSYLQMAVLSSQNRENPDPESLLTDSITRLVQQLKQRGYTHHDLLSEFSYCGFGILKPIDENTWETSRSHYGETICVHGKPQKNCYFTSGYLQGLLNKKVIEEECQVLGADTDKFWILNEEIHIEDDLNYDFELQTTVPERFAFEGCQTFHTDIDEDQIKTFVRQLPLYGAKETGLIEIFGAVITNHFADYYNRITYRSYSALCQAGIPQEDCKEMFIQAGHICAFNTFGRIMNSSEWDTFVAPMCQTKEDWFHGMIAVINVLGWGIYRVEKMNTEQEIIIRVYNSYEGIGYRRMYPPSQDKNLSFLAMGALLGLVHLLWKIDIRRKPTLTQEFYVKQFNNPENSYHVEQTHAIAANDEYDRFIISK